MRRRIHYADVACVARALMCLAPQDRSAACLRMIRQAQSADAHRLETGRPHPVWGSGALMEVARCHRMAAEPGFDDPDYVAALRVVLACLQQGAVSRTRT